MGRKVMVLSQRVNQDRSVSPESDRQLMGDASTLLEVEDMGKMQKILDLFDVISQTVCDSEENLTGRTASSDGNKLMAEIVSLRAGQLALRLPGLICTGPLLRAVSGLWRALALSTRLSSWSSGKPIPSRAETSYWVRVGSLWAPRCWVVRIRDCCS